MDFHEKLIFLDLGEPLRAPSARLRRAIRYITRVAVGFAGGSAAIPLAENASKNFRI
jgi:hypothetical protein